LLPLHYGRAPRWLFGRMVKLADCIVEIIVHEYSLCGLLERLSDPWFFQSLSCVLGYDWHSSGTTTVTCGALKEAINQLDLGLTVAGGKGRASNRTPQEIAEKGAALGLSGERIDELKHASRMAAKVDNSLVQDGYSLYHHTFVFDERGDWIVIQQGINPAEKNARRYHWPPEHRGFIDAPHNAILCDSRLPSVLDMTSTESEGNRSACLDLSRENPRHLERSVVKPTASSQSTLDCWTEKRPRDVLVMPATINWKAMRAAYEFQPRSYEEFVSLPGIGPSTVRGLALVAELVYGERPSWRDPVRFSFAFGGKDGVPYPVDRRAMDEAVDVLRAGVSAADVKREEKLGALERLRKCIPPIPDGRVNSPGPR